MGSKLKDGFIKRGKVYHYARRLDKYNGKMKWYSTKQTTLHLAKMWVEENILKPEREKLLGFKEVREIRFDEFVEDYFKSYSKEMNSERTYHRNISRLKLLSNHFGLFRLNDIDFNEVEKYRQKRLKMKRKTRGEGYISKATVNRELAVLRKIMRYSIKRGFLHERQLPEFEMMREDNKAITVFGLDDIQKFLEVCRRDDELGYFEFFYLSSRSGARFSELQELKQSHINFELGTVTFLRTKNHESRTIPLSVKSVEILKRYIKRLRKVYSGDRVFIGRKGEILHFDYKKFAKMLAKAGLPKVTFHEFSRNSFITNCAYLDMTWEQVSEWTGHKSYAMFKHYKKVFVGKDKELISKLDRLDD